MKDLKTAPYSGYGLNGRFVQQVRTTCGSGWFNYEYHERLLLNAASLQPPATAGGSDPYLQTVAALNKSYQTMVNSLTPSGISIRKRFAAASKVNLISRPSASICFGGAAVPITSQYLIFCP